MSANNPFSGGPDYVKSLVNRIESIPGAYVQPPNSSGAATSVRFSENRVACLDAIAKISGWTRNEVINALLEKGLFVLFHELNDEHVDQILARVAIMGHAPQQISPPTHGVSNMESYSGHRIAANTKQKPNGRWYSIFQYSINDTPNFLTSENWTPDFATAEEAVDYGRKQAMAAVDRNMPWTIFVKLPLPSAPLGEAGIPGNTVIPPLSASSAESALARCRDLIDAGFGPESLDVTGPNDVHWDEWEIKSLLSSGFPRQVNVETPKPKKRS